MMLKVEELNEKIDLITDDLNNKIELIIHQNEKIIRDLSSLKLTLPSDALARVEKYLKEVDDELNQSSSISITRIRRSMAWKEMLAQSISEEEIQRRVESFAGVPPSTGEQKSKKQ